MRSMPRANFTTGLKICSKCRVEQSVASFYPSKDKADGLFSACKACKSQKGKLDREARPEFYRAKSAEWAHKNPDRVRAHQARHNAEAKRTGYYDLWKYGLTVERKAAFRKAQQNRCIWCLQSFSSVKECVDHDHVTGENRGLLCKSCNVAIGHLRDDPAILLRLAAYLQVAKSARKKQAPIEPKQIEQTKE